MATATNDALVLAHTDVADASDCVSKLELSGEKNLETNNFTTTPSLPIADSAIPPAGTHNHFDVANASDCVSKLERSGEKNLETNNVATAPSLPIANSAVPATCVTLTSAGTHNDIEEDLSKKIFQRHVEDFKCEHCGETVHGNGYTNRKTCAMNAIAA